MSSEPMQTGIGDDVDAFLFGGAKAFSFANIGDSVEGEIIAAQTQQQRSIEGQAMTWDNGEKRMQLVVTLQTALRESDNDDGIRMIYAKGGKHDVAKGEGQSMRDAIASAVRAANQTRLEVGGMLVVAFTGEAPAKRGYNAAKLYTAGYRAPKPGVSLASDDAPRGQRSEESLAAEATKRALMARGLFADERSNEPF